jgi:hypothetical protein
MEHTNTAMEKVNRTSILSGIMIGIGVIVNVSAGNRYIGAVMYWRRSPYDKGRVVCTTV